MDRRGPTEIIGFKRMVYLNRIGKIRLGIKVKSLRTGKEHPKEVDYFVCPDEVKYRMEQKRTPGVLYTGEWVKVPIYGETPKLLDIMFPSEDQAEVIPYCYKLYGSNQMLKCKGDGKAGVWFNPETKQMEERKCPCPELEWRKVDGVSKGPSCGIRGHLRVILPKVSLGGVYQIDTGSVANINRILNAMDYWKGMVGRCKCIPLTLERVPEKMLNPMDGKMQTHYLLQFSSNISIDALNKAIEDNRRIMSIEYKIAEPIEEGSLSDTPIEVIDDRETIEEEKKEEDLTDLRLPDKHKKFKCEDCEGSATQAEAEYSKKNCGGRILCYKCQKKYRDRQKI